MTKKIDLTGKRFGRLVVLGDSGKRTYRKNGKVRAILWNCKCDCGNNKKISGENLMSGKTNSCGCLRKDNFRRETLDLVGKRFGKLTVLSKVDNSKPGTFWKCRCDCGNIVEANTSNLNSGGKKSCGCLISNDLVGKRFGRLTVMKKTSSNFQIFWLCECDCGNTTLVTTSHLNSGHTKSCGCFSRELAKERAKKMRSNGNKKDLTGKRFGKLTVIEEDPKANPLKWLCKCDCGNIKSVRPHSLKTGSTRSCGCLRKETQQILGSNPKTIAKRIESRKQTDYVEETSLGSLNMKKPSDNRSGVKGVCWDKKHGKWISYLTINRKQIFREMFGTKEEAIAARKEAEEKYFKPILEKYKKD